MHKQYLELNNLQRLICHQTKPNQIKERGKFAMLYSHYDSHNNHDNTNTGGTNEFIPFYLQSLVTQGGRHKS